MQNFDQKVVLITGAASGFGKLLAEKLSSYGARLVLGVPHCFQLDRRNRGRGNERVASGLEERGVAQ